MWFVNWFVKKGFLGVNLSKLGRGVGNQPPDVGSGHRVAASTFLFWFAKRRSAILRGSRPDPSAFGAAGRWTPGTRGHGRVSYEGAAVSGRGHRAARRMRAAQRADRAPPQEPLACAPDVMARQLGCCKRTRTSSSRRVVRPNFTPTCAAATRTRELFAFPRALTVLPRSVPVCGKTGSTSCAPKIGHATCKEFLSQAIIDCIAEKGHDLAALTGRRGARRAARTHATRKRMRNACADYGDVMDSWPRVRRGQRVRWSRAPLRVVDVRGGVSSTRRDAPRVAEPRRCEVRTRCRVVSHVASTRREHTSRVAWVRCGVREQQRVPAAPSRRAWPSTLALAVRTFDQVSMARPGLYWCAPEQLSPTQASTCDSC